MPLRARAKAGSRPVTGSRRSPHQNGFSDFRDIRVLALDINGLRKLKLGFKPF
jgi:hypothetical protein